MFLFVCNNVSFEEIYKRQNRLLFPTISKGDGATSIDEGSKIKFSDGDKKAKKEVMHDF